MATPECPKIPAAQVAVAVLLPKADRMFPEGVGAVRAFAKDGAPAEKTNELLENAVTAIDKLFKQRGYDPKKPEEKKARLRSATPSTRTRPPRTSSRAPCTCRSSRSPRRGRSASA